MLVKFRQGGWEEGAGRPQKSRPLRCSRATRDHDRVGRRCLPGASSQGPGNLRTLRLPFGNMLTVFDGSRFSNTCLFVLSPRRKACAVARWMPLEAEATGSVRGDTLEGIAGAIRSSVQATAKRIKEMWWDRSSGK